MAQADLEILITERSAAEYGVTLRFRHPAGGQDKRHSGRWTLDQAALRARELDPAGYGEALAAQVFAQPDVRGFVDQALVAAASQETPLHLRLFISPEVERLHALRWETLRLPGSATAMAMGERVRFSRYLDSDDWRRVTRPKRDALRALVAIASPDVTGTMLAEVRTNEELQRARAGLGEIKATELAGRGQVTLANLLANLRAGCDILYLVAHGMLVDGEPQVLLERTGGGRDWTAGRELAARLGELAQPPILVVLVSCQSAGVGKEDDGALAGLGPRLAAAGVSAVVAMQGNVSMDTAAAFMPAFLAELRRDGQVDRAMAVARGAVRKRYDWWMPVLFTRLEDGRLFELPQARLADDLPPLEAARKLLASLPLDEIPARGDLPPGSRPVFSPNPLFVGREDDLATLAKILKGDGTAAVGQVAAATGLGGIGKTQLAVEFVHRYGRFFAGGVFWLSCSDPNAVATEVVACGLMMGLPGIDALDFPVQVERVRAAWQEPVPRLLIFDNCEVEGVLDEWRPATGGCRVLVTSRRATWSAGLGVQRLSLPTLPRPESVALLRRFRADLAAADPTLDAIAAELGDLPLALHMAGSFLARYRHDVTPAAYLVQLRAPGLLAHRSLVVGDRSPTGHEAHVARTFQLSYGRLDSVDVVDALALALLSRVACFAPGEPVARDLLLLTLVRDVDGPDYEAADALRRLTELGLVDVQEDGRMVMHRLVAAFVLVLPAIEEAQGAVERALGDEADRVNQSGLPALLSPWQVHLRHVTNRALTRHDLESARLCCQLGYHYYHAGNLAAARSYLEQTLAVHRRILGEANPDTAESYNDVGMVLKALGDLLAARAHLERALAIRLQTLGSTHPDTSQSLNNLGMLLYAMGDLPAARSYYEQALAIRRQTLGEVHRYTANSLNNLGALLRAMGDLPAARSCYEQALAIRRQALGEVHPDTAQSLNNLGMLLYDMGDLTTAQQYYERALVIWRQCLGENHPDTAHALSNLGTLLQAMGDLSAAKSHLEQALAIRRQALGEAHPDTAQSLNNLGLLLKDVGDLPAARPYYEQSVAILECSLGPKHPNTQTARRNLERLLDEMGTAAASDA